jgi:hypothetical protein
MFEFVVLASRSDTRDRLGQIHVTLNGKRLHNQSKIVNHSPTGFEWGYHGSGPAQFSAVILTKFFEMAGFSKTEVHDAVIDTYQVFKNEHIATLRELGGTITRDQILDFLVKHEPKIYWAVIERESAKAGGA